MKDTRLFKFVLICTFIIVGISDGLSQTDSLKFTGVVFDRETLEPLTEAVYTKYSTTFSINPSGKFHLKLHAGDTITFRHLGYQDLILVASDSLKLNDYLAGIYLSKQTYYLSEILVFPRHYSLKTVVSSSNTPSEKEMNAAERNMRISTYQGLRAPKEMDNEMNQKMTLQKHRLSVEYKTMISPDRMVGVNMVSIVPETKDYIKSLREHNINLDMGSITSDDEQNYLKSVFVAFRKEMERKER